MTDTLVQVVGDDTLVRVTEDGTTVVVQDTQLLRLYEASAAASAASAEIDASSAHADFLALVAAAAGADIGVFAIPTFTPETYAASKTSGVCGDGTDDGPALAAMSAALNAAGRGVVNYFPGRTYYVGGQISGAVVGGTFDSYYWRPTTRYPFEINGCTGPVVINGNGARFKTLDNAKYGTFNLDGTPMSTTAPYFGVGISAPFHAMVMIHNNSGLIVGVLPELDGNVANIDLGGEWGNSGWQIGCTGIIVQDNTGPVDLYCDAHDHCQDGITYNGVGDPGVMENATIRGRFTDNCRNNLSLVGGVGVNFTNAEFLRAGQGTPFSSGPAANIDIEAEGGKSVRLINFNGCVNEDGYANLVFGTAGNTSDVAWNGGRIVGTTSSAYSGDSVPRVSFNRATLVGRLLGIVNEEFNDCLITQDPSLSPTGVVYSGDGSVPLLPDIRAGVAFRRCTVEYYAPLQTSNGNFDGAVFEDCKIYAKAGSGRFDLYGRFRGETKFIAEAGSTNFNYLPGAAQGAVGGDSGKSEDSFTVKTVAGVTTTYPGNLDALTGKAVYYGSATYDPPSLTNGSKTTVQTMTVTGVALGDLVDEQSFSLNLNGIQLRAWVSAANTVSYYFINELAAGTVDLASGTVRVKVRQA